MCGATTSLKPGPYLDNVYSAFPVMSASLSLYAGVPASILYVYLTACSILGVTYGAGTWVPSLCRDSALCCLDVVPDSGCASAWPAITYNRYWASFNCVLTCDHRVVGHLNSSVNLLLRIAWEMALVCAKGQLIMCLRIVCVGPSAYWTPHGQDPPEDWTSRNSKDQGSLINGLKTQNYIS